MKKLCLEAGKLVAYDESRLAHWPEAFAQARRGLWNAEPVLVACDQLAKQLLSPGAQRTKLVQALVDHEEAGSAAEAEATLAEISAFLTRSTLETKLEREFKELDPFTLRRLNHGNAFEAWSPLGVLVHVAPSNAPAVPFLAAVEGLLTGNVNVLKLSARSGPFTLELLAALAAADQTGSVAPLLYAAPISSARSDLLAPLFAAADGVSAWGSEEAIRSLRATVPSHTRFITWGHKISFAYVAASHLTDAQTKRDLAFAMCQLDQQACSSPQCIFVETDDFAVVKRFAEELGGALAEFSPTLPARQPEDAEAAEITKVVEVHRAESFLRDAAVVEGTGWRVLADAEPGLRASPLFRTVFVKPLPRRKITAQLLPLREYLQTAGLAAGLGDIAELSTALISAGTQRVRPIQAMLDGYAGEPHDGVYALPQFAKRISVELPGLASISSFAELEEPRSAAPRMNKPVLTKEAFQQLEATSRDLCFKSGGSSGEPKFSAFSYRDYHEQMRYAADGLVAAGLDPSRDICMNLFFAGGLYGGFLSFYTILEHLRAKQLPMAAHPDLLFVGRMVLDRGADTLLGMPSYIEQLFRVNHERFAAQRPVKKIFYGGEHFTPAQKQRYYDTYGVELIQSATYGSVDAGPLGYQCVHCEGSVHHVHTALQELEILELEADRPVQRGEIGRLVFTSKKRSGMRVERYEIGDLGRELMEPCPCGRASPRIELLGRHGDIFRAGGSFLNYNSFGRVLQDAGYAAEYQLVLTSTQGLDRVTLQLDDSFALDPDAFLTRLLKAYPDAAELVQEGTLELRCVRIPNAQFQRTPGSGKLIRIVQDSQKVKV